MGVGWIGEHLAECEHDGAVRTSGDTRSKFDIISNRIALMQILAVVRRRPVVPEHVESVVDNSRQGPLCQFDTVLARKGDGEFFHFTTLSLGASTASATNVGCCLRMWVDMLEKVR